MVKEKINKLEIKGGDSWINTHVNVDGKTILVSKVIISFKGGYKNKVFLEFPEKHSSGNLHKRNVEVGINSVSLRLSIKDLPESLMGITEEWLCTYSAN